MKIVFLFLLPMFVYGDSLGMLLEYATAHNELIVSKNITSQSKQSALQSSQSNYLPTVDIGGFYKRDDAPTPFQPGTTYSGYAKVGFDVYSGGRKEYDAKEKKDAFRSSQYDAKATQKSISLSIVQDFYSIKNDEAQVEALEDALEAVKAQLSRMKKFFAVQLATSDDVDRLQSAYEKNLYLLESVKFHKLSLQKALEVKVDKKILSFDTSTFKRPSNDTAQTLDSIKALSFTQSALKNAAQKIDSYYYPQIRVEDTYHLYGYQDEASFGGQAIKYLDNQNTLLATVNMRLFDFGTLAQAKEAYRLNGDALLQEIKYRTKEQTMQQDLALSRIKTAQLNIKSSQSALTSASSALQTITQKYNNRIVDNVVYLDALSIQTEAQATYKSALNNLEVAYALYYYYNGKNLQEFLDD